MEQIQFIILCTNNKHKIKFTKFYIKHNKYNIPLEYEKFDTFVDIPEYQQYMNRYNC